MVVERKISIKVYVLAGILTFLVFSLGLMLGIILDNERLAWGQEESQKQELHYKSLQLQYLFMNELENTNKSCNVLQSTLQRTISELGETLDKVIEYKKDAAFNVDNYAILQHQYIIDNLKYWMLAKKTKKMCGTDVVNILYFYSGKNCPRCPDQGVILTYYKKLLKERLLVFPIDIDMKEQEPTIDLLARTFDVEILPTLIIEDKSVEGITSKEGLAELLCEYSDFAWC